MYRDKDVYLGHGFSYMKKMGERLRSARVAAGFVSAEKFARTHKMSLPTYRSHENGNRNFTYTTARMYARLLGCTAQWLIGGEGVPGEQTEIPIIGYVESGGTVRLLEDIKEEEKIDLKEIFKKKSLPVLLLAGCTALPVIKAMAITVEPGWSIQLEDRISKGFDQLIDLPCIVQITNGELFLCKVLRGYAKGKYNLMRYDSSFIADADIQWAAKIHAIIPSK